MTHAFIVSINLPYAQGLAVLSRAVRGFLRSIYRHTLAQLTVSDFMRELRGANVAFFALIAGWLPTRFVRGRLALSEYLIFSLYRLKGRAPRSTFVGLRGQAVLIEILSDDYSKIL